MDLDLSSQTQLYVGLFERELRSWVIDLSRDVRTAIDVGSAEGEYSLYFLARTGAKKVFAFEPADEARERFCRNLELSSLASDSRLVLSSDFVGRQTAEKTKTLDSLVESIVLPCIIKIDVDGPEGEILGGAQKLLGMGDVRWIIETHSAELERECVDILQRNGFETTIVSNAWWRTFVPEQRPLLHNRWLIAVPRLNR